MKKLWAIDNGLNIKRNLKITDGDGGVWLASVGFEQSSGNDRYNIKGMSSFAADKKLKSRDAMHFLFFNKKGLFKLSHVVKAADR